MKHYWHKKNKQSGNTIIRFNIYHINLTHYEPDPIRQFLFDLDLKTHCNGGKPIITFHFIFPQMIMNVRILYLCVKSWLTLLWTNYRFISLLTGVLQQFCVSSIYSKTFDICSSELCFKLMSFVIEQVEYFHYIFWNTHVLY